MKRLTWPYRVTFKVHNINMKHGVTTIDYTITVWSTPPTVWKRFWNNSTQLEKIKEEAFKEIKRRFPNCMEEETLASCEVKEGFPFTPFPHIF